MKGFLEAVAKGYASRYKECLSRITFVMPNKRSGSFLLRELSTYCGRPALAPRIVTISDFVSEVSNLVTDHRLSLLFLLFDCYKEISEVGDMEFDKFSSWGETVLNDFNEIDMAMVDPDEIFKNVSDFNSIRTDFLTDDQKQVIEKYFGYSYKDLKESDEENFWKTFEEFDGNDPSVENVKKRYYNLWQVLNPLYHRFHERLRQEGLTTSGGAFRTAVERIEAGDEPFEGEKVVMVGFNALTEAERRIFKSLGKMELEMGPLREPKADFIWDPVSEFLAEEDDPAVKFVGYNMDSECFPSPEWIEPYLKESRPLKAPEVEVISVPSNVMQVKVICNRLEERLKSIRSEVSDARVAVVLPDENLLLPLLYSLPEEYSRPNLTMGYPMKHTPVVSFVGLLRRLQARIRKVKGVSEFFFEDVQDLLGHPYSQILFGREKIADYINKMNNEKHITVNGESMQDLGKAAAVVFRSVNDESPYRVLQYISDILNLVRDQLVAGNDTFLRTKVECNFIDTFLRALVLLDGCIHRFDTDVSALGVFRLAERQIARETVPFQGEPLEGLQVMGLLETRALDFKYVFMPSMNDKIIPRRGRNSTFIPNTLRKAYGMPPANYQEELFAYYFYRLAGRCRQLTLTYDARNGDNRGGGVSRYILQLRYLAHRVTIREVEAMFGMPQIKKGERKIEKSDDILRCMRLFYSDAKPEQNERKKNISPSALSHYGMCPLRFLYADVLGIYIEPEPMETIDQLDLGTIVHEVMERLYITGNGKSGVLLNSPVRITSDFLDSLLKARTPAGEGLIEAVARRAINAIHFHIVDEKERDTRSLRGSAVIVADYIVKMVKSIIKYDLTLAPFLLHGCEIKETYAYQLPDGRKINFKMVIDRLDEVDGKLRIVDYKTGRVHLKARSLQEVFDGTPDARNVIQLGFYAMILERMVREGTLKISGRKAEDIASDLSMVIYNIPGIRKLDMDGKEASLNPPVIVPEIMKTPIHNIKQLEEISDEDGMDFKSHLDRMIVEILDPDVDFSVVPTDDRCRYCDYKLRCENIDRC